MFKAKMTDIKWHSHQSCTRNERNVVSWVIRLKKSRFYPVSLRDQWDNSIWPPKSVTNFRNCRFRKRNVDLQHGTWRSMERDEQFHNAARMFTFPSQNCQVGLQVSPPTPIHEISHILGLVPAAFCNSMGIQSTSKIYLWI